MEEEISLIVSIACMVEVGAREGKRALYNTASLHQWY
jgi:hypothetical protein